MSRFTVALTTLVALALAGTASEARAQGLLGSSEESPPAPRSASASAWAGAASASRRSSSMPPSSRRPASATGWASKSSASSATSRTTAPTRTGGEYTQGPLVFDVGVGFPVTLLKLGDGGPGSTLLSFAIGAGMSVQHAYGYLRARLLFTLGPATFIELMGRWTPSEASNDWTDKTGLDVYQARTSFYFDASEDFDLRIFVDWTPADRTRIGRATDATALASWPPETTTTFQNVVQAGVHFVF